MTPEEFRREMQYQKSTTNPWLVVVLLIATIIVLGTWGGLW